VRSSWELGEHAENLLRTSWEYKVRISWELHGNNKNPIPPPSPLRKKASSLGAFYLISLVARILFANMCSLSFLA
jgi:hypothetical protein